VSELATMATLFLATPKNLKYANLAISRARHADRGARWLIKIIAPNALKITLFFGRKELSVSQKIKAALLVPMLPT